MKILIAPDSYKESLSAMEVANAIEDGFKEVFPAAHYIKIPVADGGEGTVETMVAATQGKIIQAGVSGPLGEPVQAFYGLSGDRTSAYIEMAAASGLALVPASRRNPLLTTSYGTGELILKALDWGVRHFIIGIGGSATNDGGAGMMQALGVKFLDKDGKAISQGGASLKDLARIDSSGLDARIRQCRFEVACDVNNPLTGPDGASAIFGPQKGATQAMVAELDRALKNYAAIILRDLNIDVEPVAGAGAAGGMGAALYVFCRGELQKGIEIITEALHIESHVRDAALVITGEGRIDSQTVNGKVPFGIAALAKRHGKPVIGIAGCLTRDSNIVHRHGINAVFSIINNIDTLDYALCHAAENIRVTARNIAAVFAMGLRRDSINPD